MKLNKKQLDIAVEKLKSEYPEAGCELDHRNPFELLIATVLSAQCTDARVNMVTPALFDRAPDAFKMAEIPQSELEDLIRSAGFYRTKAEHIIGLSKALVSEHEGQVPGDYDALVKLPGVGRKTANVVLAECFGQQRIAVDTHVFRLANRIGFVEETDVLKTELGLIDRLPEDSLTRLHHCLIWHGRRVCSARKPACDGCCLDGICKKNGVK